MTVLQGTFDFDAQPTGEELRDIGIQQAVDNANDKHEDWADKAYEALLLFMRYNKRFLAEDAREYAERAGLPIPPSKRAWGGVMMRAKHAKIIIAIGTEKVKNAKAHCANATLWERNCERFFGYNI